MPMIDDIIASCIDAFQSLSALNDRGNDIAALDTVERIEALLRDKLHVGVSSRVSNICVLEGSEFVLHDRLEVTASLGKEIELFGKMKLAELNAAFEILDPGSPGRSVNRVLFSGEIRIEQVGSFKVAADLADLDFSIVYQDGGGTASMEALGLPDIGLKAPTFRIEEAEFRYNHFTKTCRASLVAKAPASAQGGTGGLAIIEGGKLELREASILVECRGTELEIARIAGTVVVGGVELEATGEYADSAWSLRGGLAEKSEIDLKKILVTLGWNGVPSQLDGLKIDKLYASVSASKDSSRFEFALGVASDFRLGGFGAVKGASIDLRYGSGLEGLDLQGRFMVGKVPLFLDASYSAKGWRVAGYASSGFFLSDLVGGLPGAETGVSLPKILSEARIDQLRMSYDFKTGSYGFDLAIRDLLDLKLGSGFEFELKELTATLSQEKKEILGELVFFRAIRGTITVSETKGKWSLTGAADIDNKALRDIPALDAHCALPNFVKGIVLKHLDIAYEQKTDSVSFNLHIDHVDPISIGGLKLEFQNIVLSLSSEKKSVKGEIGFNGFFVEVSLEEKKEGEGEKWFFLCTVKENTSLDSVLGNACPRILHDAIVKRLELRRESASSADGKDAASWYLAASIAMKIAGAESLISLEYRDSPAGPAASGKLTIKGQTLELKFDETADGASRFVASYGHEGSEGLKITDMVGALRPELKKSLPDVAIGSAAIGVWKPQGENASTEFVISASFDIDASLKEAPIVGGYVPASADMKLQTIRVVACSTSLKDRGLEQFRGEGSGFRLPKPESEQSAAKAILSFDVLLGGAAHSVDLPLGGEELPEANQGKTTAGAAESKTAASTPAPAKAAASETAPATTAAKAPETPKKDSSSSSVKWIDVKKSLGPIYIDKIGIGYSNGFLSIALAASVSLAGLTITVKGLSLSGELKAHPAFKAGIEGIGVQFKQSAVEISGDFLAVRKGDEEPEYIGQVIVRAKDLSIVALGAYKKLNGNPCIFVYAVIDYPLGGPPCFFITGGAFGFGYNRSLTLPTIDKVREFPLVASALAPETDKGLPAKEALGAKLDKMKEFIPAKIGEVWLAVGVKFTSFKTIDGIALVTASFGQKFTLAILGSASMKIPQGAPAPIAYAELNLLARFCPDDGVLSVEAALSPNSYLFSRGCHLTGGFAFYLWFSGDHACDFVITLGGYHPGYRAPTHYPKPARVGLNWIIDSHISMKGELYFALTPSCVMAGGRMEAVLDYGAIKADFILWADMIVSWKPFFYDISLGICIKVSFSVKIWFVRITLRAQIGADLHIWGPEFSGEANIHIYFVSFSVRFGAPSRPDAAPISWEEFRGSFLPPNEEICRLSIGRGVLKIADKPKGSAADSLDWVIDGDDFTIKAQTAVPVLTSAVLGVPGKYDRKDIGIRPMLVDSLESALTVRIYDHKQKKYVDGAGLKVEEIKQDVSAVLWQPPKDDKLIPTGNRPPSGEGMLPKAVLGYSLSAIRIYEGERITALLEALLFKESDAHQLKYGAGTEAPAAFAAELAGLAESLNDEKTARIRRRTIEALKGRCHDLEGAIDLGAYAGSRFTQAVPPYRSGV